MKLNLGCGPHHLENFENFDRPWRLEHGLDHEDGTVDAITISHVLNLVPGPAWPAVFAELFRVLRPGGIVRITDDDTENPESERHAEPWPEAVTLTGPKMMAKALREAGFVARRVKAAQSLYRDLSLLQAWHGEEPKVFFMEGAKPR